MMTTTDTDTVQRAAAFRTECTGCARGLDAGFVPFCPDCGAMTDVSYDLPAVRLRDSPNPYLRFLDLLPVRDPALLPAAGFTPTIHATRLGERLGMPWLYLKDETGLPTGTTKDRMAAIALPYLAECGVGAFTTSSTGNSSSAYAHAIARVPQLTMYVFTAAAFRHRLTLVPGEQIVDVVMDDATFVEAFEASGTFARRHQLAAERGFFNPGRREGLKLAFLEAAEQVPRTIDWYVQAVSSAMGVFGVDKGARQLHTLGLIDRPPRLLCVQQESCAPMVSAWRAGSEVIRAGDIVHRPTGIAQAILRGDPTRAYPHVRRITQHSGGTMVAVSEAEIRESRDLVAELEGIRVCFSAATAVAGLIRARSDAEVPLKDTVLVNLTGSDRDGTPPAERTHWVHRSGDRWDFAALDGLAPRR